MTDALQFRDVGVEYRIKDRGRQVLDGVSFRIAKGEAYARMVQQQLT